MKKAYLILLPLAMLAAAACQSLEPENPGQSSQGPEIIFSSSIGEYTKATDKSFEAGDLAGLSISDPVNASNVKLTYAEGTFTPEHTLYWGLDQAGDKKCTFLAYSPYSASIDPAKAIAWTIPANQSVEGAYAGADLLTAKTQAGPADGTVHLGFNHALSRMVLTLENKVAEDEIVGVKMAGVKLGATVDIAAGTVTATGDAATVTPVNANGVYIFLVAPQTVSPDILITMKSGKIVKYAPDDALNFLSGKQLSAAITVEKDQVLFNAEIFDWLDEKIYLGKDQDPGLMEHTWYVEYNGGLQPFEKQADGTYHQVFSIGYNYAQIRIVKDDYAETWGCAIPNYAEWLTMKEPTSVIPLAPNYYFYLQGEGDLFDLVLDMKAKTLTTTLLEHKWESLGTGKFIDGLVSDLWGLPHEEMEVEVMGDQNAPGLFRIVNPYKNWSWKEYFYYTDDSYIEIHTTVDGKAWFGDSFLGLSDDYYGEFYGSALCPEAGWSRYNYYGEYYPLYGFIRFLDPVAVYLSGRGGYYMSNDSGMTSLTLPGYERPVHYYGVTDDYVDNFIDESGQHYMNISVTAEMDVAKIKYGVFAGTLSREECFGDNRDGLLYTKVIPEGTELKFEPEETVTLSIPVPGTGTYTVIFYGENAAGEYIHGSFTHYWVYYEGDEQPEPTASISAQPAQPLSDIQLLANVKFTDPDSVYVVAMTEDAWVKSGLTEDDIYDYVLSNGSIQSVIYIHSQKGIDLTFGALTPNTQYRLFVAGTNLFGNSAWAQTSAKTESTPAFTSVGIGHYTDNFLFYINWIPEEYTSEVEIQKAETTPVRYRVVNPYKEFWAKYAQTVPYSGFHAENIDFYLDGELLKYAPYYTGYREEDLGDVRYYCYNPYTTSYHYPNNCVLQEGVYNIAPYAKIEGSNYYYGLTSFWGDIYIEMPGSSIIPPQAPAKARVQKNLVEAPAPTPMAVQTEIRPFTRHMLNTGTPKVTRSQKQLSEISAEPIKK